MPARGDLTANRYRLLELIGVGGMGRVWLARDEVLHRQVALKEIVAPPWMPDAEQFELRSHAVREARTAARLNHPHVVGVYDVLHDADRPWIVMEYVPSRSLEVVLAEDGPMTPRAAARVGLSLLSALQAAHHAGVLHRDVKPQNVLIGPEGRVVLTDFGLAVINDSAGVTRAGLLIASPHYVSPERARNGASSIEADLWSLGATLYAMVEGRPPYSRSTTVDTLAALAREDPDPMTRAGSLRPVLSGLLHRDPALRLTGVATARMLRAVAGTAARPVSRPPAGRAAAEPSVAATVPVRTTRRLGSDRVTARWLLRRRTIVASAAAALLCVLAVAASASDWSVGATIQPGVAAATAAPCTSPSSVPSTARAGGEGPTALPSGWDWYTDPTGFRVGIPTGWTGSVEGGTVCFRDPDGTRGLAIAPMAPQTDPVGYWRGQEQRLADLAGYERIGIEPVIYQRGGADWTYRWGTGDGRRAQTLRRMFTASTGAGYTLAWTTSDHEWALNQPNLRIIARSFVAA